MFKVSQSLKFFFIAIAFGASVSHANGKSRVDYTTPIDTVVSRTEGSFPQSAIRVDVDFSNPDECNEQSGRNCNPFIMKSRCQFAIHFPVKDENGYEYPLALQSKYELRDVFADSEGECQHIVAQWRAQLPETIHYSVTTIDHNFYSRSTYANPVSCIKSHNYHQHVEVDGIGMTPNESTTSSSWEDLDSSICDKLFGPL